MIAEIPVILVGIISGFSVIFFGVSAPISIPLLLLLGYSINSIKGPVLIVDVVFAATGTIFYKKTGKINWKIATLLTIGALGAIIGVYISTIVPEQTTTLFAALFEITTGTYILYDGAKHATRTENIKIPTNKYPALLGIGLTAGFFKGYLGMGWGPIAIPLLILFGVNSYVVVASSLVSRIAISLTSGVSYAILGYAEPKILINLLIGGLIGTTIAMKTEKNVSEKNHRKLIGTIIMILGIIILI